MWRLPTPSRRLPSALNVQPSAEARAADGRRADNALVIAAVECFELNHDSYLPHRDVNEK